MCAHPLELPYFRNAARETSCLPQTLLPGVFKSRLLTGVLAAVMGDTGTLSVCVSGVRQTSGAEPHALNDPLRWALAGPRLLVQLSTEMWWHEGRRSGSPVRIEEGIKAHQMDWLQTVSEDKPFSSCEIRSVLKERDIRLRDAAYGLHFSVSWYLLKLQPPLKTLKYFSSPKITRSYWLLMPVIVRWVSKVMFYPQIKRKHETLFHSS